MCKVLSVAYDAVAWNCIIKTLTEDYFLKMTGDNATSSVLWVILLAMCCFIGACSMSVDSGAAAALFERQKLGDASALTELESDAGKGAGPASFFAGLAYQLGPISDPGRRNKLKAKSYYEQAKLPAAAHNLALILLDEGKGEAAVKVLLEYADSYPQSLMLLGRIYLHGLEGVPKNYPLAYQYFDKVVRFNKDPQAEYECAVLLYTGRGIEKDTVKAVRYWESSAKFGNVDSKKALYNISTGPERLVWMAIVINAQPNLKDALESKEDFRLYTNAELRMIQQRAAIWIDAHPTRNAEMKYMMPAMKI